MMLYRHLPRAARLALMVTIFAATPVFAGPPWISIEYPANPFDKATKDALVIVHTNHHGLPMQFPVHAYAEGIVNGAHQRIPLQVVATSRTGIWAVRGELPKTGSWVIRADMTDNETGALASALIAISNGQLAAVQVPTRMQNGWVIPMVATQNDVDALLATQARFARR